MWWAGWYRCFQLLDSRYSHSARTAELVQQPILLLIRYIRPSLSLHLSRSSAAYLKMGTRDALRQFRKDGSHDSLELVRIYDIEDFFQFVQKHALFRTVDFGPVPQKSHHHLKVNMLGSRRAKLCILFLCLTTIFTSYVNVWSFSKNWTTQYASCGWYKPSDLTLWRGTRTRVKKILCSSFSGKANPLIILPRISNSSATPLCLSVS